MAFKELDIGQNRSKNDTCFLDSYDKSVLSFEGVCCETTVILAPGAMTGEVGAALADTVSGSSASSGSSGSEFRAGTDVL